MSDAGGIYPGARSGARLSHRGGDHSHHSFSNGNRWEAASFSLLLFRGHFRFSSTSRFWGQEAARILAASAGELVPSSSSEESPPPASAWGAASSFWGGTVEEAASRGSDALKAPRRDPEDRAQPSRS